MYTVQSSSRLWQETDTTMMNKTVLITYLLRIYYVAVTPTTV